MFTKSLIHRIGFLLQLSPSSHAAPAIHHREPAHAEAAAAVRATSSIPRARRSSLHRAASQQPARADPAFAQQRAELASAQPSRAINPSAQIQQPTSAAESAPARSIPHATSVTSAQPAIHHRAKLQPSSNRPQPAYALYSSQVNRNP